MPAPEPAGGEGREAEGAEPGSRRRTAEDIAPSGTSWRPVSGLSAAPSPAQVLPELPHPDFRVQCIPLQQREWLEDQLRFECEAQSAAGLRLASTFTHDGDLFLVFKRAHWITLADVPTSASPNPEAAGAERRAGGFQPEEPRG